jgi:hypothetical protein
MRKRFSRKDRILIIAGVIVLLITAFFIYLKVNAHQRVYTFYYPDSQYQKMHYEKRLVTVKSTTGETFEANLVREYVLGPIHNELKMSLMDSVSVKNVWVIPKPDNPGLVINFNDKFEDYLSTNSQLSNDVLTLWFIQGLVDTLRANTKIKNLYLMSNNRMIYRFIGKLNLSRPIPLIYNKNKEKI